jgi:Na+/H+-dicarboxylate symporter
MKKLALHWQILLAIILAIAAGTWSGDSATLWGVRLYDAYHFIGTLFLNALKMIIVPLVMSSIITGMAGVGAHENLGRVGLKTMGFYLCSSFVAIVTGLVLVNMIQPGLIDGEPAGSRLNLVADAGALAAVIDKVQGSGAGDIVEVFLRMVPVNVVNAAAQGQMLGLIFFSLLYGFYMTRAESRLADMQVTFWQGVFATMMAITMWVMRFAPLGVFGLVAKTVAATGFDAFKPLMWFFLCVTAALAFHALVTLPLVMRVIAKVNPVRHYQAMFPALLTAFSTASSSATLPVTIECVEKNAGVSNRTSSFVLPLGATVNMDGTALYECVAAMFIAQAYGLDLGFTEQFLIVLVALLTSIGVAGIPAASLVAITVILGVIGLPLEALGLLLVTDRILDMLRTSVNVFSDSCGAVMIARTEGETDVLAK